jgi:hypothetical protein
VLAVGLKWASREARGMCISARTSRRLHLVTLGLVLLAGSPLALWAQDRNRVESGPRYPSASEITFEWDYSCPSRGVCSFACSGSAGISRVDKLTIYLGTIPLGRAEHAGALFYDFSSQDFPRGNGFEITTGIGGSLSCQVRGMTLDYSGPPK